MHMETIRMIITAMWAVVCWSASILRRHVARQAHKTGNRPSMLMIANRPTKNFQV